jgi:hypothetical protein
MYIIPDEVRNEFLNLLNELNECTTLLINSLEAINRIEHNNDLEED